MTHGILRHVTEGHVIIIGGSEDKVRDRVILSRFVALAGGSEARIAVVSTRRRSGRWPASGTVRVL